MLAPGAATLTVESNEDHDVVCMVLSRAATEIGSPQSAGADGRARPSPSLPEEATTTTPWSSAYFVAAQIGAMSDWKSLMSGKPSDRFTTSGPWSAAQRMAVPTVTPSSSGESTLIGMTLAPGAIPVIP